MKQHRFALIIALALEEIMPAFAESKLAKPTALVSGDTAKANQVTQHYGIKPQNVYGLQPTFCPAIANESISA